MVPPSTSSVMRAHRRRAFPVRAAAALLWLASVLPASAGGNAPSSARAGEALAREAAMAWSDDARLVYVENDEPVTGEGVAARWGYLFFSPSLDASRAYSVQDGDIRVASHLSFDFPAPPLPDDWIDSAVALAAAGREARGQRTARDARIRSVFLVRGLLDTEHPDRPTWAVVYDTAGGPGLWIVVDARSGEVVKTWRG